MIIIMTLILLNNIIINTDRDLGIEKKGYNEIDFQNTVKVVVIKEEFMDT